MRDWIKGYITVDEREARPEIEWRRGDLVSLDDADALIAKHKIDTATLYGLIVLLPVDPRAVPAGEPRGWMQWGDGPETLVRETTLGRLYQATQPGHVPPDADSPEA